MTINNLSLVLFILIFGWGADCPNDHIEINEECYFKPQIDVLQDFIDLNENLNGIHPLKIGYQEWTNNRLTHLYLGGLQITTLPDSIGLLKDLNRLDLRKNNINFLGESICSIYPYYSQVNLSDNEICPPYPFCFEYIDNQDTKTCESFKCPSEYQEIQGECYKESHIKVLQAIIDSNSALNGLTPLELGKNIGYQQWENGSLTHLNLISNQITTLPENLCTIYKNLKIFDVSNNFICPPYPQCFEYIGNQDTENCNLPSDEDYTDDSNLTDNLEIISYVSEINADEFHSDLAVLQDLIDKNESLTGMHPLEIGRQSWSNMRLVSLDLSSLGLTFIPAKFCSFIHNLNHFDVSDNVICPPYPQCFDYISKQNTEVCGDAFCPDNYIEIEGECYYKDHINVLQEIIYNNPSLLGSSPLDIADILESNTWIDGKLNQLILVGKNLTNMPENICNIYPNLSVFEMTNNSICPPYPDCIDEIGHQNIEDCFRPLSCPEGFVLFDEKCYYFDDLQVLIDFTKINDSIHAYHPLLLGYQVWKDNRLHQLFLDGLNITHIPESIDNLEHLVYLNLNNNMLESLPESLCNIYPHFKNLEITNNLLCPPYLDCFDYVGQQNIENCEYSFCPYGYLDLDEECYFENDIAALKDIIEQNESLRGRGPLDIGVQKWKDMHLDYLYLGVNNLTTIPESICEILPQLKTFNISQNNICQPYPACVEEFIGNQNVSDCP